MITRYVTSNSQLEDGVDGVIVPMDNDGCAEGVVELLRDSEKMKELGLACSKRDYTNALEVEKLYKIIRG